VRLVLLGNRSCLQKQLWTVLLSAPSPHGHTPDSMIKTSFLSLVSHSTFLESRDNSFEHSRVTSWFKVLFTIMSITRVFPGSLEMLREVVEIVYQWIRFISVDCFYQLSAHYWEPWVRLTSDTRPSRFILPMRRDYYQSLRFRCIDHLPIILPCEVWLRSSLKHGRWSLAISMLPSKR